MTHTGPWPLTTTKQQEFQWALRNLHLRVVCLLQEDKLTRQRGKFFITKDYNYHKEQCDRECPPPEHLWYRLKSINQSIINQFICRKEINRKSGIPLVTRPQMKVVMPPGLFSV